jgi:hypothetical protein
MCAQSGDPASEFKSFQDFGCSINNVFHKRQTSKVIKPFFKRKRFVFLEDRDGSLTEKFPYHYHRSMPSGHQQAPAKYIKALC